MFEIPKSYAEEPEAGGLAVGQESLMDTVFDMLGDNPDLIFGDESSEVGNSNTDINASVTADASTANGEQAETGDQSRDSELPWVLCIDDDTDYSEAMKLRLEVHGVAVVRAFDGMGGYRKAFTHPASAILLDYELPNGQGDYVLRRLKENPVTRDIPVIAISGVKDNTIARKMIALGAVCFLHKPVKFQQVRNELANYIDILRADAENVSLGKANSV